MGLDKSWMQIIDRTQLLHEKEVIDFIEVVVTDLEEGNVLAKNATIIFFHLKESYMST